MRIALLIDSLGSGGAQRQLVNLAGILKECGYEVVFLVYRDRPFFSGTLHEFGIQEIIVDSKSSIDLVFQVRRTLRELAPDYVISFLETPNFLASFASIGQHGWRLIINELSAKEESFTSWRGRVKKLFSSKADAIVCNSYNAQRLWAEYYPKFYPKLSVIYNPVLFSVKRAGESVALHCPIRLVIPASFQYLKNPVELVKAVGMLSESERENLVIDWYGRIEVQPGDTRAYDEAAAYIDSHSLENCVKLHDAIQGINEVMRHADYIGLFSTVEGLPNAICEAMALGKPVIMTPVSDYLAICSDSRGVVCTGFDCREIAAGLQSLLSIDCAEYQRMSSACAEYATREFSKEVIADKWVNLLRDLDGK